MSNITKLFLTQYKEYISSEIPCMPKDLCSIIDSYIPKKVSIPKEILGLEHYTFHYKDNIVYIVGGIKETHICNTIFVWDIQRNTIEKVELLYNVWLHESIIIDNDIYIVGGQTTGKSVLTTIQKFNIHTYTYVHYSNMIHPRCSFSLEYYKDTLFCIGGDSGYNEKGILSSIEAIHIPTKQSKLCKKMEYTSFFHSSCCKGNYIYVFGGLDSEDENFIPYIRIYDIKKNIWSKSPIYKFPIIEHSSILYKNTILLYGGYNDFMNIENTIYQLEKDILTIYKKNEYPILSIIEIDNTYYKITKEDNYVVFSLFT